MGYFEIFYAWLRAHMKSVFGSFVKEVFVRILITILLFGVYFKYITPSDFIYSLVLVYGISLMLIVFYANKVKKIVLHFKIPKQSKAILTYTVFIILSASIANMLLDIDKYMIKYYMKIDNIAFYSVAIFIAMVISVPSRAMHQITYPITAKLMSENKWQELTKSISTPVGDDENKETYADRYLVADAVVTSRERADLQFDLQRALGQLKPKQAEALCRNYGIGLEYAQSMEQIGEEMGITNERARQLVRQAEIALAQLPGIQLLEQYL
jgi:hypothetical protein